MDDRLSRVESTLRDLQRSLTALDRRVAVVEQQIAAVAAGAATPAAALDRDLQATSLTALAAHEVSAAAAATPGVVPVLSLVGRTFVVLGGAFLLRALTDSSVLPVGGGIALGLAYASLWIVAADRAAARRRRLSAFFHGVAASIVAFPLVWEAATKFSVLDAAAAAAVLAVVTGLALASAVRRRLQPLAWIATIGSLVTMVALVAGTGAVVPFAVVAVAIGVATLWIGYTADWTLLRWPAALVADFLVAALPLRISAHVPETLAAVLGVQLFLLTAYLASIAVRTIVRRRDVNVFEVAEALAALAIGFGGAVYTAHVTGSGAAALAIVNLLVAVACYGVAFAFVARRQGMHRNFHFYTALALVLVLVSGALLLEDSALALVWTALAVATSWLGRQAGRRSLSLHGAVYAIAAAGAAGLLAASTSAMILSPGQWRPFTTTAVIVLAALGAAWAIGTPDQTARLSDRLPRLLLATALFWTLCGWLVAVVTPPVAAVLGGVNDGVVATMRTAVLGGGSVLVAWTGRHDRFRETGWLLYPVLVVAGLKLLTEDLPRSKPAALFVALAVYGIVLIAAPRLRQVRGSAR